VTASAIVWDGRGDPPGGFQATYLWRSYEERDGVRSIPRYLESHAERLRQKYLAFIHELGQSRLGGKRIIDHLDTGDGFSYWWMTTLAEKSPFKSPRIYDCLRLFALEEILLDQPPVELVLHSLDADLREAIAKLCDGLEIGFSQDYCGDAKVGLSLRSIYRALPYAVQALLSLRHILPRRVLCTRERPPWHENHRAVFFCSYFIHLDLVRCRQGSFYSRQWGALPNYLQDIGRRTNWIQHFIFSAEVPDIGTGSDWVRKFNLDAEHQGCHAFLDHYLSWQVILKSLRAWLWLNFVSWRLWNIDSVFSPQGSAVWLWPVLRSDWKTSTRGSVSLGNCFWVYLFDAAIAELPHQPLGLYLCENQAWEKAFLNAWRKYGHGEIVGVQHATVPFWHLYYFDDSRSLARCADAGCLLPIPDRLAVNGSVPFRALTESGYPTDRLVEVEALRYQKLGRATPTSHAPVEGRDATEACMTDRAKVNVLIVGDMIPASMQNLLGMAEGASSQLQRGFSFTLKPHPGLAVHLDEFPSLKATQTTQALDQMLPSFDCVLSANSTSASVDAYVAGLPVIVALDGGALNLSPLRGQPGVRFVSSPDQLAQALLDVENAGHPKTDGNDFFHLDTDLPRWKRLLRRDDKPT